MAWYDELAVRVQGEVDEVLSAPGYPVSEYDLSSRAKTIETLRDKLQREWGMKLPSIQDVAGVRFVGSMPLFKQDLVVRMIRQHYSHPSDSVHDLRDGSHAGYRAVHVWLRLEDGRVEVQVRTTLQNQWANAYEALADLAGRQIRYGGDAQWREGVPDAIISAQSGVASDLPEALRLMSTNAVAGFENLLNAVELFWNSGLPLPDGLESAARTSFEQLWRVTSLPQPPPEFGLGSDAETEDAHSALIALEGSLLRDLEILQGVFEDIRAIIERGRA